MTYADGRLPSPSMTTPLPDGLAALAGQLKACLILTAPLQVPGHDPWLWAYCEATLKGEPVLLEDGQYMTLDGHILGDTGDPAAAARAVVSRLGGQAGLAPLSCSGRPRACREVTR